MKVMHCKPLCRTRFYGRDGGLEAPVWADRQRTLFSQTNFMAEEPEKPRGRKRKPQLATLSMLGWALIPERRR